MPMPVSVTLKATTRGACSSAGWSRVQPLPAMRAASVTPPFEVNFRALDNRLVSNCLTRWPSVRSTGGRSGAKSIRNVSPLASNW